MPLMRACALAGVLALQPALARAHVFAQPYSLPVPFEMYAYGATGALLFSFVVVGLLSAAPVLSAAMPSRAVAVTDRPAPLGLALGRLFAVALLVLCIATGMFGTQNAFANFNMTFFWIGFVLAVPYAVAVVGDFYGPVNPWHALTLWLERATGTSFGGRLRYPPWLGYVPALLLYMAFIWLELFGQLRPRGLAVALVAYTLVNLVGAYVYGRQAWFRYGEFFGVFLRITGKMSPWARTWDCDDAAPRNDTRRWRAPFVGLLDEPPTHISLVLFILFMLSSTAFDGLHSTLPWVNVYWKNIYPDIAPWLRPAPGKQYLLSTQIYYVWQWLSLLVSPLVYLAVFAGFAWAAKLVTRSPLSARELVLRFAMPLVPIAFVYNVTHYYTLLLSQGVQIVKLASDPFGFGWNLFGTAQQPVAPVMLDVGTIWMTQVVLIVAGHIVSVYLAHLEALRLFVRPGRAAVSQLPMLALMMSLTVLGLWILSLPLASGG